jgi:hypothetical protein|tara:strand:+ start:226 stop:462 length:237 start_codon:yes stop_codon:yes gene_type:complete
MTADAPMDVVEGAAVKKKEVERGNKVLVTPLYGVKGARARVLLAIALDDVIFEIVRRLTVKTRNRRATDVLPRIHRWV